MEIQNNIVVDYSQNGYNGVISGNPVSTQGILGDAISFNAQDDYIDMGNRPVDLVSHNTSFTMSVWFKTDYNIGDNGVIGGIYGGNYKGFLIRQEHTGQVVFLVGQGGNIKNEYTVSSSLNIWINAVLTYDGKNISIYLNGKKARDYSIDNINNESDHNLVIGRNPWDNVRQYQGVIDEVTLLHRAMSALEVDAYYKRMI